MDRTNDARSQSKDTLPWEPDLWEGRWRDALARHQHPHGLAAVTAQRPEVRETTSYGWLFWSHDATALSEDLNHRSVTMEANLTAIAVTHPGKPQPSGKLAARLGQVNLARLKKCVLTESTPAILLRTIVTCDRVSRFVACCSHPRAEAVAEAGILAHHVLWGAARVGVTGGDAYALLKFLTGMSIIATELDTLVSMRVFTLEPQPTIEPRRVTHRDLTRSTLSTAAVNLSNLYADSA